ncbi:MAG: hypothetical protein MJ231_05060 [bacterium]|nr:hypothetical protein [bacterium]
MRSIIEKDLILKFNKLYNEIFVLESILRVTKSVCLNNDINATCIMDQKSLSYERNDYINLLSVALSKVEKIKQINDNFCEYMEILQ